MSPTTLTKALLGFDPKACLSRWLMIYLILANPFPIDKKPFSHHHAQFLTHLEWERVYHQQLRDQAFGIPYGEKRP